MSTAVEPFAEAETLSLGERAYRRLRDSIVQGTLSAGSRISERSLASALGISAQPVREALRRLEQDGLVVTLPRRGTIVAEFGLERLAELGRIRAALEGVAAALAAERMTGEDLASLGEVVRGMRDGDGGGGYRGAGRAERALPRHTAGRDRQHVPGALAGSAAGL